MDDVVFLNSTRCDISIDWDVNIKYNVIQHDVIQLRLCQLDILRLNEYCIVLYCIDVS